jgi:hypothetical protein
MITRIEVRNTQGGLLPLTIASENSGIIIEDITGLDPVKATVISSSFAMMDGSQYQTSQRGNRNIVMTLDIQPDYIVDTVRSVRTYLYGYFMPKTQISITFYFDDDSPVSISGIVESFDFPLFTQTPKGVVSIICFDPDFLAVTPQVFNGATVTDTSETSLYYGGNTATGFSFAISPAVALPAFTIYNRAADNTITSLDFEAPLNPGDVLTISTVFGSKFISLNEGGFVSSLLYGMNAPSDWVELAPGLNYIRVAAGTAAIPYTITYTERYGGL